MLCGVDGQGFRAQAVKTLEGRRVPSVQQVVQPLDWLTSAGENISITNSIIFLLNYNYICDLNIFFRSIANYNLLHFHHLYYVKSAPIGVYLAHYCRPER